MKRLLSGERMLARVELRFLLLLGGLAALVWGFLTIGGEMAEGETLAFDQRVLLSLRVPGDPADPIGPRAFEEAMRDVTALGGFTVLTLVTVVATLAFAMHRRWKHAGVMAGTILLAQACSRLLKNLYDRPRPDLAPHLVEVYSGSFPSGHAMLSAATYLTLAALIAHLEVKRRAKVLVFVLALLLMAAIGFSRVYLGVHWPSDVAAGWCVGAAWAFGAWLVLMRLEVKAPPPPRP
jgi:undecaprenyl-diphosphatase